MPSTINSELGSIDYVAMAFGDVPQYSTERKFSEVVCLSANTEYTVAYGSTGTHTRYPKLTVGEKVNITSTSTSDTSAGVGCRTFYLQGVDQEFNQINETITMNGTSNVLSTKSYIAITRGYVLSAGTSLCNVGDITATTETSTLRLMTVQALHGQTQIGIYIVPKGKKAIVVGDDLSVEKVGGVSASVAIRFLRWNATRTVFREWSHFLLDQSVDDHHHSFPPFTMVFEAGEMIEITANSTVNNTPVRAVMLLVIRDV